MHLKTYLATYFLQKGFYFYFLKNLFSKLASLWKGKTHKKISLQFIYLFIYE